MAGSSREPVIGHGDRNRGVFFGFGVEDVKLAVELVHNVAVTAGAWPPDIPRLVGRHLRGLADRHVVGIEIEVAVTI